MALDIAGCARVYVLPPGAADAVGALNDQQIVDTLAAQRYCGSQPTETGADDDHLQLAAVADRPHATGEVSTVRTHRTLNPSGVPAALDAARMVAYSVGAP